MADTLTLQLDSETSDQLRRIASETGESVEAVAQRLLEVAAIDFSSPYRSPLTEGQLADLDERLKDPGPLATSEEVETFFARFKS